MLGTGLFGAALLYGDGVVTPAISVLRAVEGLEVAIGFFKPFVVPITILTRLNVFNNPRVDLKDTFFFLGKEYVVPVTQIRMPAWQGKIFAFMLRNSLPITEFFEIPHDRLIELGIYVEF